MVTGTKYTDDDRLLEELGIDCVWLMPFHPSAQLDDGYAVKDYYGVDPASATWATSPRRKAKCHLQV